MLSIAIVDIIGLTYDGTTLSKRGLGGSESAVILMSKELQKLGFSVTVFNNCIDKEASPGIYDGVTYIDISNLYQPNDYQFDIIISSRTTIPFTPESHWNEFQPSPSIFKKLKDSAKLKILWMHDTFCKGDHLIESMVLNGDIDEIFTLSDFHTSYVTNCEHGKKRNFEVLKRKIFFTRNGISKYTNEIDISKKDKNLFVYNASVTKGMIPLVEKIWERVKQRIPNAKLKIIGGYYRFREGAEPDEQEKTWRKMISDKKYENLDIDFTGVISQKEISDILTDASFMIYPGAFPETFGISSLESLYHNTPLITTRFGALEETAIENACYLIDYPIEPNGLFPHINQEQQINKFIDMVIRAYNDPYLHQQKSYYCNIIKDISGWDSVALQWMQHFYRKLSLFLPIDIYRKVKEINTQVHQVFGRRFSNPEEWVTHKQSEQNITIVSTLYNAQDYIEKCIHSVASQDYDNYLHILVNDCSTDSSKEIIQNTIKNLPERIRNRFILMDNDKNHGAVYNQIKMFRDTYVQDDSIIMVLDGDDWLVNEPDIFDFYNNLYHKDIEFTYGSCYSVVDNIPLISQPYPNEIKKNKSYREYKFNWGLPYTHLRTFRKRLVNNIDDSVFKDENGEWFRAGGDVSTFYNIIEQANPDKVECISRIVYHYNDKNPLNDYKVNADEQNKNAKSAVKNPIIQKEKNIMKKILIAIPTNKYVETSTMKAIYDLEIPEGYDTELQFFYGYQVDQIRNLIANWAERYDYLFSVDSDISFKPNTLKKLLSHNKDIVSGLYIQRKPNEHILEVYRNGTNIPYQDIEGRELVEIDGCGFGCVLVDSNVIRNMEYPHFLYQSAIDHRNTVSEDTYFCNNAKKKGYRIFADTSILCEHHGSTVFSVQSQVKKNPIQSSFERLMELSNTRLLPKAHLDYLYKMKKNGIAPKVIYDIGACVLHWTREAINLWSDAKFIAFEAMEESAEIFNHFGIAHHIGLLSDQDDKQITFYQNTVHPGGNSYYKENSKINKEADLLYNDARTMNSITLDTIIKRRNFPLPDLIKMDVQGAELDILKGASNTLEHCSDLILELQKVEYNKGAPLREEVISYLESIGFKLVHGPFSDNGFDGDYHFRRNKQ